MKKPTILHALAGLALLAAPAVSPAVPPAAGQELQEILRSQTEANERARATQERIEKLDDEVLALTRERRAAAREAEALENYNRQITSLIGAQDAALARLRREIEDALTIERIVLPLMDEQMQALEAFIALDAPFLLDERQRRLRDLQELNQRVDVSAAEKYRALLAAFEQELEYGRTIEVYDGRLALDGATPAGETPAGATRAVEFLRIGRLGLFYQTPDGALRGAWRSDTREWEALGATWADEFARARQVANGEIAPELLVLPILGLGADEMGEGE